MRRSVSVPLRFRARGGPRGIKRFFQPFYQTVFGAVRSTFRRWAPADSVAGPVNESTSWGGIRINPETALQLSAVWGCVFRYASVISTLPLKLMRVGDGNTATVAGELPLYTILHDRPNSQMSASVFWQAMVAGMLTWGAAYARKVKVGGRLVALIPLRPEFMTVVMLKSGVLEYHYAADGMEEEILGAEDVFVVLDRTMDGYTGLSRIEYARNSLGMAIAGDRAASNSWRNGLRASGFVTVGQWLTPEQRTAYRTAVQAFSGTGNGDADDRQGGVMVLENATKFEQLTLKPADVELLDSRRFSVEEICRWYDVPPVLVGHAPEGQTMWGSGIEQVILGWQKLGLAPIVRRIEQEIWRQLLTPEDQKVLFAEFNLDALMRGDSTARAAFYSSMSQNGIMVRNEIRARENLPPIEGGDVPTVQSSLVSLAQLVAGGASPEAEQVRSALRAFLQVEQSPSAAGEGEK
jgi:HK97 family phage portal protein